MLGLKLAAAYGYPPARLGFCGTVAPQDQLIINRWLQGENRLAPQVRQILSTFKAAYSYYQLIASQNKIQDPFDQQVVEAYWLGNKLLGKVNGDDIRQMIQTDFGRPGLLSKKQACTKASRLPAGVLPYHLSHVLFIGSISGRVKFTPRLIDLCRIGWGEVVKIPKLKPEAPVAKITVRYRPLVQKNKQWQLGLRRKQTVKWDKSFVPRLKKGETVSFHWGRACQVLNRKQTDSLKKYSKQTLDLFNSVGD